MIPVNLVSTKTKDGVRLEGIYVGPARNKKAALVWVHGLTSRFSSGQPLIKELSSLLKKNGFGYLKFNTRGHDVVNKDVKKLGGSGFEKFTDCVRDIRAMISFARRLGYRKIILAGHSTGANKIVYYLYRTRDRAVKGLILVGAVSDVAVGQKMEGKRIFASLRLAEKLRQKDPDSMMPRSYGIYTARRYLSLYRAGSSEDVFPYHNPKTRWKEIRSVRIPLAVIFGSRDEYIDRAAKELLKIFEKNAVHARSFSGIIIKGAGHSFRKKEKELAEAIIKWIRAVV